MYILYNSSKLSESTWKISLFQSRPIIFPRKVMQRLITLALNEKIVASTWVGEILAMRTKGGIMISPRINGKRVDDVKKRNVKTSTQRAAFWVRPGTTGLILSSALRITNSAWL